MRAQQAAEERAKRQPVEVIMAAVTAAHNQPFECLRASDRTHKVAWCRHHAIWEVRQRRSDLSLTKIAAWFDREDHTTILNSIRKFNLAIKEGRYVGERTLVERALSC
jgi:chromosomal replication initiation ATPase DnaA